MSAFQYFAVYKPFGMLSQFSDDGSGKPTLKSLFDFPKDVYPVGRLDHDSEGLLILTNDKSLNHQLTNPKQQTPKTYWVQVEGAPTEKDLEPLRKGVSIKLKKGHYTTQPAVVTILEPLPEVPDRDPPVRYRKTVPDTWISISITEGKNRQVRKMTAKAGFPTLRLIRVRTGKFQLTELVPGQVQKITRQEIK